MLFTGTYVMSQTHNCAQLANVVGIDVSVIFELGKTAATAGLIGFLYGMYPRERVLTINAVVPKPNAKVNWPVYTERNAEFLYDIMLC